jgi:excisionase family DNA binding protein
VPSDLYTAEEIAEVLKVDPKTVLNWAKAGIIPEAFRVGRTVRFSLEAVKASLDVNCAGEGRRVELAVLALKLVFGDDFPKLPNLDTGSITIDETTEIKRLCAIHAAALEELKTPQERFAYTEGALDAAKMAVERSRKSWIRKWGLVKISGLTGMSWRREMEHWSIGQA